MNFCSLKGCTLGPKSPCAMEIVHRCIPTVCCAVKNVGFGETQSDFFFILEDLKSNVDKLFSFDTDS